MAKPLRKILEEELTFANERLRMYEDKLMTNTVETEKVYLQERVGYYSSVAQQMRDEILKDKASAPAAL